LALSKLLIENLRPVSAGADAGLFVVIDKVRRVPLLLEPSGHRVSIIMVFRAVANENGGHRLWRCYPSVFTKSARFWGQEFGPEEIAHSDNLNIERP
jgi:hypothetical protein